MSKARDFTQGNIFRHLVIFSGPIMLTDFLQTSYQIVDSLWIGNLLGANALGAVAVSSAILFAVLSFVIGLNNATLAILSQQKGRDDEEGLRRYLNAFVVTLSVLVVIISIGGILLTEPLLHLLGTPEAMFHDAKRYLFINFIGIAFLVGYNFISAVLRSLGDSRTPLIFVALAVVLNVFLDPLFIAGFQLGIAGAAFATILSQGCAFLYGVYYVWNKGLVPFSRPYKPKWKEVNTILYVGIPSGLQMAVISAGLAAIMSVVTSFGEAVTGGFGAAQRIENLLLLPAGALGTAVSSMAGQNIGAKNWRRVHQIARYGLLYNFMIILSVGLIVFLFAEYFVKMFTRDAGAVQFAAMYLKILAFFFPFLGVNFVLNGIVRASGSMYQVLVLNILSFWVLRYPLTYVFAGKFGEAGIGFGIGTSFVISSMIAALYYMFGKWKEKELF